MKRTLSFLLVLLMLCTLLPMSALAEDTPKTVTITLDYGDGKTGTITATEGQELLIPQPSKEGYSFQHWLTDTNEIHLGHITYTEASYGTLFTAVWTEKPEVTITFNSNGGTPETQVQTGKQGTPLTYPPDPTRAGYKFLGWYRDQEGTLKLTEDAQFGGNGTFYAKWQKLYTITFDSNGGSRVDPITMPENEYVYYYDRYGNYTEPTREGHMFTGWCYPDGNSIDPDDTITSDITLKAEWAVREYRFQLDPKVGSLPEGTNTWFYRYYGQPFGELPTPTSEEYEFVGWFLEAANLFITPNTIVPALSGEAEHPLTARWTKTIEVTFDPNGGEGEPTKAAVKLFTSYDAHCTFPTPRRENYVFDGWYTAKEGGTKVEPSFAVGAVVPGTDVNHTLYAHWKGVPGNVSFNIGTGTGDTTPTTFTYGSPYGTLPTVTPPEGYVFDYWALPDGTPVTPETIVTATTDHELTAVFLQKQNYTVTSGANQTITQGSTGLFVSDAEHKHFIKVQVDGSDVDPGHYTHESGSTRVTLSAAYLNTLALGKHTLTIVSKNGSATTNFTLQPVYCTVSFDLNCSAALTVPASIVRTDGDAYGTLPTVDRTGYVFNGWFTEKTGGTQVTAASVFSGTSNQVLYAQYTPISYTVSFNSNGGKVDDKVTNPAARTVAYDSTYGTLPTVKHDTLYFAGWYTAKEGGTRVYASTVMQTAGDHTLYAHWSKVPLTGDNTPEHIPALTAALLLSLAGLAATAAYAKKRKA